MKVNEVAVVVIKDYEVKIALARKSGQLDTAHRYTARLIEVKRLLEEYEAKRCLYTHANLKNYLLKIEKGKVKERV